MGIRDNFFEFGGDSILSIQVIARANQAGIPLTTQQFFQHQTIAELAALVLQQGPANPSAAPTPASAPPKPTAASGAWAAEDFPEADLDELSFDILMDQIG
jgi:aryl carrier-like protein